MTKEEELDYLRGQAETIKGHLEQIEARMREMETEE
jgi:prefoldin subunit 5